MLNIKFTDKSVNGSFASGSYQLLPFFFNCMKNGFGRLKLQALIITIRSSLWFFPLLAVLASVGLAMFLIEADRRYGQSLHRWWPRVFSTEAEGARSMLSAIAGSIATIAGVAFSITIVALVLASTQYTSRVLRTFMRDRATQIVLGVFVGVYIYCLLVLRSLAESKGEFVPPLAVLGGLALAVISVGFFIFFIHHISSSIQAAEITAAITRETLGVVEHMFPDRCSGRGGEAVPAEIQHLDWKPIPAQVMGYIQTVDIESMAALARKHDVILRMECGIGDFVAPNLTLLSFSGPEHFREAAEEMLGRFYAVGTSRTIEQDPGFGIRQLVDIALKALSPGINDTTTAVTCIQHLSAILLQIAPRQNPSPLHYDEEGNLRVISKDACFEQLAALSFNQILENAEGNTEILTRLLDAIAQLAPAAILPDRKSVLRQWTMTISEVALRSSKSQYARAEVERHIACACAALSCDSNR